MYNLRCEGESKYVENYSCKLNAVSREKTTINLDVHLKKNVSDIIVVFRLYRRYNTFKPFLIDFSFNLCKFLDKNTILHKGYLPGVKLLLKDTNANHSCPYDIVKVKDARFDPNLLPSVLPTGTYMGNFTFYEGRLSNLIGMLLIYINLVVA